MRAEKSGRAVHGHLVLPMTHGHAIGIAGVQLLRMEMFLQRECPLFPLDKSNLFGRHLDVLFFHRSCGGHTVGVALCDTPDPCRIHIFQYTTRREQDPGDREQTPPSNNGEAQHPFSGWRTVQCDVHPKYANLRTRVPRGACPFPQVLPASQKYMYERVSLSRALSLRRNNSRHWDNTGNLARQMSRRPIPSRFSYKR